LGTKDPPFTDDEIPRFPLDDSVVNFVFGIKLSADEKFLYYGMQGRGVFIYDVTNPKSKIILQ
jgi:hypothetical protein